MAGELIDRDGQIEWGGILLGATTAYRWVELTGWDDIPGLDSGAAARPARHGAWPGRAYAGQRVITLKTRIRSTPANLAADLAALVAATALGPDAGEAPLVIRTAGGDVRLVHAQITARLLPGHDVVLRNTGFGEATLQWTCSDPRRYSLVEHAAQIDPPTPGEGLTYPLTYPLDYGEPGSSGNATVTNAGDTPTFARIVFTGPLTSPQILNQTSGRLLAFGITLAAGETLTVDCDAGTVTLNGTADRLYTLTPTSVPVEAFELIPGDNLISLRASATGSGAQAALTWRDASL